MTCNICFEENKKLINKPCCTFQICESCSLKLNICPQCQKELKRAQRLSATDANQIMKKTEQYQIKQEQEKAKQQQIEDIINNLRDIIISDIYDQIQNASQNGMSELTYKRQLPELKNIDLSNDILKNRLAHFINDIYREFKYNKGYNINVDNGDCGVNTPWYGFGSYSIFMRLSW